LQPAAPASYQSGPTPDGPWRARHPSRRTPNYSQITVRLRRRRTAPRLPGAGCGCSPGLAAPVYGHPYPTLALYPILAGGAQARGAPRACWRAWPPAASTSSRLCARAAGPARPRRPRRRSPSRSWQRAACECRVRGRVRRSRALASARPAEPQLVESLIWDKRVRTRVGLGLGPRRLAVPCPRH